MLSFIKIEHYRSAPFSFEPPRTSNVSETYIGPKLEGHLKEAMEQAVSQKRPFLKQLIKLRSLMVKRFGIKTEFSEEGLFGPFDVNFINENEVVIKFDDPHFSFYAEGKNQESALTLHTGVHFKTPTGMIYFWSVYLIHVQVFKAFMRDLYTR